jgi:hypothetical protein
MIISRRWRIGRVCSQHLDAFMARRPHRPRHHRQVLEHRLYCLRRPCAFLGFHDRGGAGGRRATAEHDAGGSRASRLGTSGDIDTIAAAAIATIRIA